MEHRRLAFLFLSILALASCTKGDHVYEKHCRMPPSNWYMGTEAGKSAPAGGGVISPIITAIELRRTGTIKWNGYTIKKVELKGYLDKVEATDAKSMIHLRIEDGTSCVHVERVRKIMLDSAICQASEQYCTENSSFEPPPPEIGV